MPRYAIAFHCPSGKFLHKVVEMDSRESALRYFFNQFANDDYSADEEGYVYFKEDFSDLQSPSGDIMEI